MVRKNDNFEKLLLPNGLTVVLYKMDSVMSASAVLFVRVGAVFEKEKERGISHLVEHAAFIGTEKYPSIKSFSNTAENLGITYSGGTGSEHTFYTVKSPNTHLDKALELLNQLVFHPLLSKEGVLKERGVILSEYGDFWNSPERAFHQTMMSKRFKKKDHPYGWRPMGIPETVETFGLEKVKEWRKKYYLPQNMILSVAGNFDSKQLKETISSLFGHDCFGKESKEPTFNTDGYSKSFIYNKKDRREQIYFYLTFPAFGWRQFDKSEMLKLRLLTAIFGGIRSSRLYMRLREEERLVYRIGCSYRILSWMGAVTVEGSSPVKDLVKTMGIVKEEIKKAVNSGFTDEEIKLAKNYLSSKAELRFDNPGEIADILGAQMYYEGRVWLPDQEISEIEKITKEDINALATKIFDLAKVNIGFLGTIKQQELRKIEKTFGF